ncbi:hypothetical protein WMF28_10325 [Sorangium sp. So ce590]|uniref:hypothetical protein n=1 Tax=Sorangium sp. So ce590 TaxID=3133317 RepID=UPI003F5E58B9
MHVYRNRFALLLLLLGLLLGVPAWIPVVRPSCPSSLPDFVQPFLITFDRHEVQVIAFTPDHPAYEAIEEFVTRRLGRPPLLRAIITLRDGFHVDHYNDPEIARDRAAIFTGRETVYRPIDFEEGQVDGFPAARLRFTSFRGEDIDVYLESSTWPVPEFGGFIDPLGHSQGDALPVLWADTSAAVSAASSVTIDGEPVALGAPAPGVPGGIFSLGFRIGVVYEGRLELTQIRSPRRLAEGEHWLYHDHLGNRHLYRILGVEGNQLTIRKTTTSPALTEEIIEAEVVRGRIELRSVRATGRTGFDRRDPPPPPPAGLTLDLSAPGRFSLSLDENPDLITGTASQERDAATSVWTLQPIEPSWARSRQVTATVTRDGDVFFIQGEVDEP